MLELFKKTLFGSAEGPVVDTSKKYQLNKIDVVKVLTHTGIIAGITALTYLGEFIANIDFKEYTTVVVIVANAIVQTGLKWLKSNDVNPEPVS